MDSFIDFEIDTSSDDEDERILSSVLEKIDNELKEKYPSYLQKLTNLDFVKETSAIPHNMVALPPNHTPHR